MLTLDGKRLKDGITWSDEKDGYVYKGNNVKVTQKELYKVVAQEVERYERKQQTLATRFVNGNVSFEDWQKQSKELVKQSHVNMTRLGRGGKDRTFGIHYLQTAQDLRTNHYPALKQFAQDIKDGKLTNKQIIARSKLYGSASKTAFERARVTPDYKNPTQLRLGRRRLGSCRNHCQDCISYALIGWQPLEQIILPGTNCACHGNCCCSIEIKKVAT